MIGDTLLLWSSKALGEAAQFMIQGAISFTLREDNSNAGILQFGWRFFQMVKSDCLLRSFRVWSNEQPTIETARKAGGSGTFQKRPNLSRNPTVFTFKFLQLLAA